MTQISVQKNEFTLNPETMDMINRAVRFATDRFSHVVRRVDVSLLDLNGPRGGSDKLCKLQLKLYPHGFVVVKSRGDSLLQVVNKACSLLRNSISRRLDKRRNLRLRVQA